MTETTHIICAHCGADNSVSNSQESDGTLKVMRISTGLALFFECQNCKIEYKLPATCMNMPFFMNCPICKQKIDHDTNLDGCRDPDCPYA